MSTSLVEAMMIPGIKGEHVGVRDGLVLNPVRQGIDGCVLYYLQVYNLWVFSVSVVYKIWGGVSKILRLSPMNISPFLEG